MSVGDASAAVSVTNWVPKYVPAIRETLTSGAVTSVLTYTGADAVEGEPGPTLLAARTVKV